MKTTTGLPCTWAATLAQVVPATGHFTTLVGRGCPGLIPPTRAEVLFPSLGRLATGVDDPDGRAALLAVLAQGYQRLGLSAEHHDAIAAALTATVRRFGRTRWTPELDTVWSWATHRALDAVAADAARTLGELYDPVVLDRLQCAQESWLMIRPVFDRDPCVAPAERGTATDLAVAHLGEEQEIYLCGPPAMVRHAHLRLLVEGVPAGRVHAPAGFSGPTIESGR